LLKANEAALPDNPFVARVRKSSVISIAIITISSDSNDIGYKSTTTTDCC